jgi:hypothetical protein
LAQSWYVVAFRGKRDATAGRLHTSPHNEKSPGNSRGLLGDGWNAGG